MYIWTEMSVEELTNPNKPGYFYHLLNHWWPINENGCVMFFGRKNSPYASPQCNMNLSIANRFVQRGSFTITDVKLIPVAFHPINLSDYDH